MGKQKQQSLRVTTQDIQVLTLARFRFGRVLLHLLAMLGDRCVRFHIAGITRELGRGSTNVARGCRRPNTTGAACAPAGANRAFGSI
jgi:hypothetical protein